MSTIQKVLMGLIGLGMLTSAILPDRKTAEVLKAAGGVFQGSLKTAMTGR